MVCCIDATVLEWLATEQTSSLSISSSFPGQLFRWRLLPFSRLLRLLFRPPTKCERAVHCSIVTTTVISTDSARFPQLFCRFFPTQTAKSLTLTCLFSHRRTLDNHKHAALSSRHRWRHADLCFFFLFLQIWHFFFCLYTLWLEMARLKMSLPSPPAGTLGVKHHCEAHTDTVEWCSSGFTDTKVKQQRWYSVHVVRE